MRPGRKWATTCGGWPGSVRGPPPGSFTKDFVFADHGRLLMFVVDLVRAYMLLFICKYVYIHTYIAFAHLFISLIVWLEVIWGLRRRGVSLVLWMFFERCTCVLFGEVFYDVQIGFIFGCRDYFPFVTLCFLFCRSMRCGFCSHERLRHIQIFIASQSVAACVELPSFFSWCPSSFVSF